METKIFNGKPSTEDALVNMEKLVNMEEQVKMEKLLMSLKKYDPSNDYKKKTRKEVLKNAEDLLEIRNKSIRAFKDGIFPLDKDVQKKRDQRSKSWLENVIKKIRSGADLNVIIDKTKLH